MMPNRFHLTLAIMKPDIVAQPHILREVWSMILTKKFYFVQSRKLQLTPVRANEFYREHEGKFFLSRLVSFMSSGPIWTHILAREDAITEWRKLMGPTKVLRTIHEAPDTVRGKFGLTDTRNCTHGSDSPETACREIEFFFPEFDVDRWFSTEGQGFQKGQVVFDETKCVHIVNMVNRNSEDVS